ncbi:MAG: type II toxin-antitoxin system YafQ family toxin [Acidobacteriota bacterium]|jgi:mRNA interferase YafQ|nr:type II toxin-antitoxin system YafQ family toxin [Acidobacteriota bacterium]
MKYDIIRTGKFKRDYKLIKKRGYDVSLLKEVVGILANGETLPAKYKDHTLKGNWVGHRDCHILDDWLLIYRIDDELALVLSRTGRHSDVF